LKILLTGAKGFTGRHLAARARAAGQRVQALDVDLCEKDTVRAAVAAADFDVVIHLAAMSFVGHANAAAFYAVNVVGTGNLLEALARRPTPPQRVILASSANIYGNCDVSPIGEDQPPAPVNHYALSKLSMEYLSRIYADRLPILLSRPFNYTGPSQAPQFVIPKLVQHFASRATCVELGNVQVEREFNDVRMVCDAYLALATGGEVGGVYNICSGRPYTLQQVIDLLQELTGHHLKIQINPQFIRANEVKRLYGNPSRLRAVCARAGCSLAAPELRATLLWMLHDEKGVPEQRGRVDEGSFLPPPPTDPDVPF